jgi:hypothetical protein
MSIPEEEIDDAAPGAFAATANVKSVAILLLRIEADLLHQFVPLLMGQLA